MMGNSQTMGSKDFFGKACCQEQNIGPTSHHHYLQGKKDCQKCKIIPYKTQLNPYGDCLQCLIGSSFQHPNFMTFPSKLWFRWFYNCFKKMIKNLKSKIFLIENHEIFFFTNFQYKNKKFDYRYKSSQL